MIRCLLLRPVLFDEARLFVRARLPEGEARRAAAVEMDARTHQKQHGRDGEERHRGRGNPLEDSFHQILTRFSGAMKSLSSGFTPKAS